MPRVVRFAQSPARVGFRAAGTPRGGAGVGAGAAFEPRAADLVTPRRSAAGAEEATPGYDCYTLTPLSTAAGGAHSAGHRKKSRPLLSDEQDRLEGWLRGILHGWAKPELRRAVHVWQLCTRQGFVAEVATVHIGVTRSYWRLRAGWKAMARLASRRVVEQRWRCRRVATACVWALCRWRLWRLRVVHWWALTAHRPHAALSAQRSKRRSWNSWRAGFARRLARECSEMHTRVRSGRRRARTAFRAWAEASEALRKTAELRGQRANAACRLWRRRAALGALRGWLSWAWSRERREASNASALRWRVASATHARKARAEFWRALGEDAARRRADQPLAELLAARTRRAAAVCTLRRWARWQRHNARWGACCRAAALSLRVHACRRLLAQMLAAAARADRGGRLRSHALRAWRRGAIARTMNELRGHGARAHRRHEARSRAASHWQRAARRSALPLLESHAVSAAVAARRRDMADASWFRISARALWGRLRTLAEGGARHTLASRAAGRSKRKDLRRAVALWHTARGRWLHVACQRSEARRAADGRAFHAWRRAAAAIAFAGQRRRRLGAMALRFQKRAGLGHWLRTARRAAACSAAPSPVLVRLGKCMLRWVRRTPALLAQTSAAANAQMRLRSLRKARRQWRRRCARLDLEHELGEKADTFSEGRLLRRWRRREASRRSRSDGARAFRLRIALAHLGSWRQGVAAWRELVDAAARHRRRSGRATALVHLKMTTGRALRAQALEARALRHARQAWLRVAVARWASVLPALAVLHRLWQMQLVVGGVATLARWWERAGERAAAQRKYAGVAAALGRRRARAALHAWLAAAAVRARRKWLRWRYKAAAKHSVRAAVARTLRRLRAHAVRHRSAFTLARELCAIGVAAFRSLGAARALRVWRLHVEAKRSRAAGRAQVRAQMSALWADVRSAVVSVHFGRLGKAGEGSPLPSPALASRCTFAARPATAAAASVL